MYGMKLKYKYEFSVSQDTDELRRCIEQHIFYDKNYSVFTRIGMNINKPFVWLPDSFGSDFIVNTVYHSSLKAILTVGYSDGNAIIMSRISNTSRILLYILGAFVSFIALLSGVFGFLTGNIIPLISVLAFTGLLWITFYLMASTYRRETNWAFEQLESCIKEDEDISRNRYSLLQ